ncbi:hypothetical protein KPP03845_106065 [Streptomyces xanthophaeus]|uniref:hypothetical protein n=1 Tax=Streptomyces xanthophaeus TaxID=67385 RepID=UPI00233E7326|nr:hypothetical protein [Streptomyces xanthophaeus]WCD89643.1 hypothetical protein KPP03845_106065 [Streptomyces xanthophaeus]
MRVRTGAKVRACLGAALGGAIVLSSAGCSPEQRPLAAVYVDQQGAAHALLRSCGGDGRVRAPGLRGTGLRGADGPAPDGAQDVAPGASPTEETWNGWYAPGLHEAADFPLFAPPASWAAESRGPQDLVPGHSYELAFADPDDSYAYSASVTFDARRLAGLPAGEVLTLRGTMTREAFEDLARQAC